MAEHEIFYHYTTKKNAEIIKENKKIAATTLRALTKDPQYEEGVSFTKMGPSYGKEIIAMNNSGALYKQHLKSGNVDFAIKVMFPKGKGPQKPKDGGNKSLYLIKGDVLLQDEFSEIFKV